MTGDLLTNLLIGVASVALGIAFLGPHPDVDGGRWRASWYVKALNGIAIVCSTALIIRTGIGMPVGHFLIGMFPVVVVVGVGYAIGRRRRHRRLAAQREAARLSEARRTELTE